MSSFCLHLHIKSHDTECSTTWCFIFESWSHKLCRFSDDAACDWSYRGKSACRWAASLDPSCLSGPNLRKSLWYSNPVKTWHTHKLKTMWKLIVPMHLVGIYFSDMRVANAASLALMLQERAEPSLLFLRARIAMILQILRTERHQEINGLTLHTKGGFEGWGRTHNLARAFVSARRSSAPSVLCAPCLKARGQSAAPSRLARTLGSGQSSPQPTAINFKEAFRHQFANSV